MVVKEFYRTRKDGVKLYKTYSDAGVYIRKEGQDFNYKEAIDVESVTYNYVETDISIPQPKSLRQEN